jgi:hypothetical protein
MMKSLFPGHYRPTEQEMAQIWKTCFFIFDTSVLLNLYRYPEAARLDLLGVLRQVATRAWIPHQVALEFQENRLTVIYEQIKKYDDVLDVLTSIKNKLEGDLLGGLQLRKRHSLINPDGFLDKVQNVFDEFTQELEQLKQRQPTMSDRDELRDTLDSIFEGRIGEPPKTQHELDRIYEEGNARYEKKIAPGYKDKEIKEKVGEKDGYIHNGLSFKRIYGDLIIWHQIMAEAAQKNIKSIIFVTDDEKEDWWNIVDLGGKKTIGPRTDLVEEIRSRSGVSAFYMYNSERFLTFAKEYLNAQVTEETINQVRDVAEATDLQASTHLGKNPAVITYQAVYKWLIASYSAEKVQVVIEPVPLDFYVIREDLNARIGYTVKFSTLYSDHLLERIAKKSLKMIRKKSGIQALVTVLAFPNDREADKAIDGVNSYPIESGTNLSFVVGVVKPHEASPRFVAKYAGDIQNSMNSE